jgi:cytidylate kinase
LTYPQLDITSSIALELSGKFPHTEVMADILIENVPAELYSAFKAAAKRSGLTIQEAVIKALENYVENSLFDERFERISQREDISIDPAEIAKIITEERSKRP